MAHFRATIKGTRGQASRLGTEAGISATVNGWTDGISIKAYHNKILKRDGFEVFYTGGSNRNGATYIGKFVDGVFYPCEKV